MNSPRMHPTLTYLNLFNDAEKFLREKLLLICIRYGCKWIDAFEVFVVTSTGWNGLSTIMEKPVISRYRANRIADQSIAPSGNIGKSIANSVDAKATIDPLCDEILIPNWTYSTSSGVVYTPIREKCLKTTKRSTLKKTKTVNPNIKPILETNHHISVRTIISHLFQPFFFW